MSVSRLRHRAGRVLVAVALVAGVAVAGVVASPGADSTVQAVGELGAGGEFHGLEPARIFDSRERDLDVAPFGAKAIVPEALSRLFDVQVVGEGGLPAFEDVDGDGADDNVLAVAVTITVIAPDQIGFLRAFGTGAQEGDTSVVNFFPNTFVPNSAILR
ncbi:MAG: hypothetical protein QNJ12_17095, partial [Ilumatobacter sp.]